MNKNIIFTGDFDPLTLSDINIIDRALKIFDKVFLVVNNPVDSLVVIDEKLKLISTTLLFYPDVFPVRRLSMDLTIDVEQYGCSYVLNADKYTKANIEYIYLKTDPVLTINRSDLIVKLIRDDGAYEYLPKIIDHAYSYILHTEK